MGAGIGEGDKGVTVDLKWALKKKNSAHHYPWAELSTVPIHGTPGDAAGHGGGFVMDHRQRALALLDPPPTPQCSQNPAPVLRSPHVPTTSSLLLPRRFYAPAPRDRGGVSCSNDFISKFTFTATV